LCALTLIALVIGVIVLLVLVLNPTPPPPDYGALPLVTDYDFDTVAGGGWQYLKRSATNPASIADDALAPVSPMNIAALDFTGTAQDTEPGVWWHPLPAVSEVYAEFWIKFSKNWTCSPAGCSKLTFFFPPNGGGDLYMGIYCDVPQTQWPGQAASCPDNNPDHFVVGGQLQWGAYGGWPLLANVTRTPIQRDRWYHLAHYLKWSSTPSAADGIWRVYVDGVLNLEKTDIVVTMPAASEVQIAPTRQFAPPPGEFMWLDHIIVRGQGSSGARATRTAAPIPVPR